MSKFRKQHMAIQWHDIIDQENVCPAAEAPLKEKATLVGRVGLTMLSVGTGAWRVRASMNKIARALGITCCADIGLLSIEYTCIDGGETHARAAREVADAFGVTVPIFGMVKDDRHRTRALMTPEGQEIGIAGNPAVFALIGQIQEETHRFAITFHHESHTKSALRSALDGIPGVGPQRQEALRKHFGTVKAIRQADVDALSAVVPRSAAEAVWAHFHPGEEKSGGPAEP